MASDSKKRQELKRQIDSKTQIADIHLVEKVAKALHSPKQWQIVEKVASVPGEQVETERFVICFDYLNWRECLFDQFDPTKGKKLIEILEQVAKCEVNKFPGLRLIRDSVSRGGSFDSLFSNLSNDVSDLKETEFCGGRIFFFITEPRFHIVSIETKHRNID